MFLPTAAVLGVFVLYPLARAAVESLYSWDLLFPRRYVGIHNYQALLASGSLAEIAARTLTFAAIVVTLSVSIGLGLALLLNRTGKIYAFVRPAVFSAYVVSCVAV